jgi:hypothetical protein
MGIQLKNNASGTLATAINASDTGVVLTTGNGASFPALKSGEWFYATLESTGGTTEVVKVTVRSGDAMTVVRAQEGSTAQSFAAGSRFELRVTAQSVLDTRGFVTLQDFGGAADGSTDNTPALNAALTAIAAGTVPTRTIFFPRGAYYFNSRPNDITTSVQLVGENKGATVLYRNFNGATNADGLFNFRAGGGSSRVENMGITGASGTTGGCLISLVASSTSAPDFSHFQTLYLTSAGNTHAYTIYMDGTARTGAPIGVRDTFWADCSIFGGTLGSIYHAGCVATHFSECDTFPAGGVSGKLVCTGTPSVYSYYLRYDGGTLYGIDFDYTYFAAVDVAVMGGDVNNTANTNGVIVTAGSIGNVQDNWTNSAYYASSNAVANRAQFKSVAVGGSFSSVAPLFVGPNGPAGTYAPPSGTGNAYGAYITPPPSGIIHVDALTGGSANATWNFRNYFNGVYYENIKTNATGQVSFPSHQTTASAANAFLDSSNKFLFRSTSSLQYKTQVEPLAQQFADKVLQLQPIWYRSTADADRKDWSWFGLGAEDVAKVEPRLVHWKWSAMTTDDKEQPIPAPGATLVPDGVQYERIAVLLLDVVKRQEQRIAQLEALMEKE